MKSGTWFALRAAAPLLGIFAFAPTALIAQAPAARIEPGQAGDYLGEWTLYFPTADGEDKGALIVAESEGQVTAKVRAREGGAERKAEELSKSADGIVVRYKLPVKGRDTTLRLALTLKEGKLAGRLTNESGSLASEVTGERPAAAGAAAGADGDGGGEGGSSRRGALVGSAKLALGGKNIAISHGMLSTEKRDYKAFKEMKGDGAIEFSESIAMKLKTEANLKFGAAEIKTGNAGEGYPGVYSLWLKREGEAWKLVFNSEPDIWGTMRDPGKDVAEAPLQYAALAEPVPKLTLELKEAGAGAASLRIAWGDSEWKTEFSAAP